MRACTVPTITGTFSGAEAVPDRFTRIGRSALSTPCAVCIQLSSRKDALGPVDEFRDLAKVLHRAGIEVILASFTNHTVEGNAGGSTICSRGLANEVYYILDRDRAQYANYSDTGNTLNVELSEATGGRGPRGRRR
jgi:hypothetical protein